MKKSRTIVMFTLIIVSSFWAIREWQIHAKTTSFGGTGPDVIVGDLPSIRRWGAIGNKTSFSVGTTSCNIGNSRLNWISNSNVHPVIPQSFYRVKDGRIEMIGTSWLKHGFAVAAGSHCNSCTDPAGNYLGVGCSDPYSSSLNGSHSRLGPRSEVNATTGFFNWPHTDLPSTNTLDGRIIVLTDDINGNMNAGARYFAGSQYIHPEDASNNNDLNNASYREAFVEPEGSSGWDIEFDNSSGGPQTVREDPAIYAWQAVHPDVELYNVDIVGDDDHVSRVIVGVRVTEDAGVFHTEVAVFNLNSHQSVRSVGIEFCAGTASNPGFHDIDYQHEDYSGTDWSPVITGNELEWSTQTFAQNQDANAIRWNTMYSFWCDSDNRPTHINLGLFRPGTVSEMTVELSPPVVADGTKLLDGIHVAGTVDDLTDSDDVYYELDPADTDNPVKQKIHLVMQGVSPTTTPSELCFHLESNMSGGPSGDVIQTIELKNYDNGTLELMDLRSVANDDETVTISATGDLSRFVQEITNEMTVHIIWKSDSFSAKPFDWFIDVDKAVWNIFD